MKIVGIESRRFYKAGYEVRDELWDAENGDPPTPIKAAYNVHGDYIGDTKTARRLCVERGIAPVKSDPQNCVCSIGYSATQGKWYGWSHRAIYGFKVGSTCKEGDCHYDPKRGPWTAKTITDAKQMAMDFAEGVS